MKILLINHYAGNPRLGMEFRPYYMAQEWQKRGHEVLIVGASFSHLRKIQPDTAEETIHHVHYRWLKTNRYNGNGIGRIISMFLFIGQLYWQASSFLKNFRPDIVIASSTYPLDIYPAEKIARKYGAKLIYEIHDLWPLSPMELGGYSKNHPFIKVMQRAENMAYQKVDAVVCMLPKAKEHTVEHGLAPEKFHYVPNGVVVSDWDNPDPLPEEHVALLKKLKSEQQFIVGFAGAHGIANSLQAVIRAAHLQKEEKVALVLVGNGQEKENLKQYVKNNQIENVYFLPAIRKLAIPTLLQQMDILYIGLQKQSLFRFGISPNKIFDYMMAKKPFIQAIEAGNNLVKEAGCGLDVEPDNVEAITAAIKQLHKMSKEEIKQLGENGYQFVMKNHTYDILAERFLHIMENI